ncbi:MAG: hypothetical protein M0Z79_01675 [Nitrospiraceae bacterium]|nr:hypothetical protein [Nitrospiraceae bacterium]
MPKQARLDVPGALHHIMLLGINKAKIFDIDIVTMPAVVSGIQYFELDRENGKQLITITNARQVSTSLKFIGDKDE